MIELTRTHEAHSEWNVKVLGVGGAGSHAADRLTKDGLPGVEILVANTDSRALSTAATVERLVLGQRLTRGLGTGGDPELGRAAAQESMSVVGARLEGASLVVLLVGLGGGTGSGAAPCIAETIRAQGVHVVVFATLPFSFEGKRRREQALEALDALRQHANLVVCFENDRMSAVTDPSSGIEDAFEAVDSLLAQAVRAVATMTRRKNVMHSGLDEIAAVVAEHRATALFGYGVAEGEERARAAVARAFASPLLDSENALAAASRLWVFVAGGSDLRWSEVQILMQEVTERISQEVRVFFGAAVDPRMAGSVAVTLLAGIPGDLDGVVPMPRPVMEARRSAPVLVPEPVVHFTPAKTPVVVSEAPEKPAPAPTYQMPEPPQMLHYVDEPSQESKVPQVEPERSEAHVEHAAEEPLENEAHEWKPLRLNRNRPVPATEPAAPVSERVSLPVEIPVAEEPAAQAVQSTARTTPIPPYELSKERRREAALQAATRAEAAPVVVEPTIDPRPAPPGVELALSHDETAPAVEETLLEVRREAGSGQEASAVANAAKRAKDTVQEQMRFESPNRGGRFEKTDPTIVNGEDLDVPTFMRQRLPLE